MIIALGFLFGSRRRGAFAVASVLLGVAVVSAWPWSCYVKSGLCGGRGCLPRILVDKVLYLFKGSAKYCYGLFNCLEFFV